MFSPHVGHQVPLVVVKFGTSLVGALEHFLLGTFFDLLVHQDVGLEVLLGSELTLADVTLVHSHVLKLSMRHQIRPAGELRRTGVATVNSVRGSVVPQGFQVHESLVTVVTAVRILTRVPEGVLLQLKFPPKSLATFVAGPGFAENVLQIVMSSHILI